MQSNKYIDADKITYGTYYQALLMCRKEGRTGRMSDRKVSYMPQDKDLKMFENKLKQEEEKERLETELNQSRRSRRSNNTNNDDFDDLFTRASGSTVDNNEQNNETFRLSQVLENSLYIEFCQ